MDKITESREFHNPFEVLEWKTLQEGIREAILGKAEGTLVTYVSYCLQEVTNQA